MIIINLSKGSMIDFRIKDKIQIIKVWLEIAEKLLNYEYTEKNDIPLCSNELVCLVKQNYYWRLYILDKFYPEHRKIIVMSFPFYIYFPELGNIMLKFQDKVIRNREISMIRSTLEYTFNDRLRLPLYDSIIEVLNDMELQDEYAIFLNDIMLWLLSFNDGYIRYDYDFEHENGSIHPLYHLDIFFSNYATFKIGLARRYQINDLLDLLDQEKSCKYLN
ncbi:hypothetical protein [Actinobacillus pleuropneumoniae]|uniref:Uncharacterized protein n=2 Tax=Actinobacillus pleuropneumoniae TaxID=715 RepID=A0A9Q4DJN3_ACTPL|nr:hypothetical protein [Actinobacillus pleuropneumoniae]MCY6487730.1 hypothetical protein [Actinobacillus pleuropneumoniae]MCY6524434.1 hypothetical protein [Actinobacillus pleuropneumoniae]UKH27443.1 hypothetical protein D1106_09505 [Actinobacillus pleuropneumoniae]